MSKEYLEKEALLAQIRESRVNNPHLDSRDRHAHDTEHRHFEYMVFSAKPADVAPVMKGEWEEGNYVGEIGSESEWFCSECGYVVLSEDYPENWHFCPNCGADMRKEVNNEQIES